ncbi:MAG: extracellular solute-binding protein [Halobaculum sp.]
MSIHRFDDPAHHSSGPTASGDSTPDPSASGASAAGTRRGFLRSVAGGAAASGAVVGTAGCLGASGPVTVFHAGSLSAGFADAAAAFEAETGRTVRREALGSVGSVRKVTELGRSAELLAVSDYRLLRELVVPAYADWYAVFATNAMAVIYTADSRGADRVETRWPATLADPETRVAHSDPAVDPNGYRAVMATRLGAVPFEGERLYDPATADRIESSMYVGADTEVTLLSKLSAGALDYAWGYASTAAAHDEVRVHRLGPHVNLARASPAYARHYARVRVASGDRTVRGAPIAYGLTVPATADDPAAGARLARFLTVGAGREAIRRNGLRPMDPVVPARTATAVPDRLRDRVAARDSIGPLEL